MTALCVDPTSLFNLKFRIACELESRVNNQDNKTCATDGSIFRKESSHMLIYMRFREQANFLGSFSFAPSPCWRATELELWIFKSVLNAIRFGLKTIKSDSRSWKISCRLTSTSLKQD